MKYLLDTHAFLWAAFEPDKLSPKAAEACENGELWLSAASVWEIAIKSQIGRLPLPGPVRDFVGKQLRAGRITLLPINAGHACRAGELPLHHRDPFDRMLVAQSLEESLPLISRDPLFVAYSVDLLW